MKATTTSRYFGSVGVGVDIRMTPTVRVESITRDVAFGMVPYLVEGLTYYNNPHAVAYASGILSFRVVSKNVSRVEIVNTISDELAPLDVFDIFNDDELESLLAALNEYFGNDSTKVRNFLTKHKDRFGKAFRLLNA